MRATCARVADEYKAIVRDATGRDFPEDPYEQLDLATKAVFASWFGKRAHDYREYNKIAHDLGTAVNVVTMVFGNMGDDSGTGVAFTRDPNTGEKALFGEYLTNAQGEDVVAGIRTPQPIAHMQVAMPAVYDEFQRIADRLERHYRDVQDLEFTIERGRLYMLQTRSAKRTAAAAVKIAVDMVAEGIITPAEAIGRIEPAQVDQLLRDQFDPAARGPPQSGSSRASTRRPAPRSGERSSMPTMPSTWVDRGEKVILVRIETSPDDFHGMAVAEGIITARGGATSHAAVVARQIGKPCVAGSADLVIDYRSKEAHCAITGSTSRRATGSASTARPGTCSSAPCRRCPRGSRTSPSSRRSSAGRTASAGCRSGRTPTSPRRQRRRAATAPRGSACAGPSTCSARASGWRSSAARSSSRTGPRGRRRRLAAGGSLSADEREAVCDLRRGDGEARGAPAGRLRGDLRGDGRPAGRHPAHRSAAPRVPAEPGGAARQGHEGRRRRHRRGSRAPRDDQVDARAEPDARAARLPPRPDDPGLREGPDEGDPQRRDRPGEGRWPSRSPRS